MLISIGTATKQIPVIGGVSLSCMVQMSTNIFKPGSLTKKVASREA